MSKKILLIANSRSVFITRLLQSISNRNTSDLEIEVYDRNMYNQENNNEAHFKIFGVSVPLLFRPLLRIPKLKLCLKILFEYRSFINLARSNKYDSINIHELPFYSLLFIRHAHKLGIKTVLTPIGSDALRIKGMPCLLLKKAFNETDYITITENSGFAQKVFDKFNIDRIKVRNLSYGSDAISEICQLKGRYSREALVDMLNIPYANYYICCGYNAHRAQNHAVMMDALATNAQNLPRGYKILIPLGYGDKNVIRMELEELNEKLHLDIVYMMDFLPAVKVAALRLITDLFIHIQDTDAHSFTIREFLLADTQIINGRWLSYPELEQYGIPYHVCDNKETLRDVIGQVLTGQTPTIVCSPGLNRTLRESSWDNVAQHWTNFYKTV